MILVLMGVCGCGKTTVGVSLAEKFLEMYFQLGLSFADADEFHSEQNRQKMSQGLPLTDEVEKDPRGSSVHGTNCIVLCTEEHARIVQFQALSHDCTLLFTEVATILNYGLYLKHQSGVVTCSALKKSYREILRFGSETTDYLQSDRSTLEMSQHKTSQSHVSHMSVTSQSHVKSNEKPEYLGETGRDNKQSSYIQNERNSVVTETEQDKNSGLDVIFVHLTGSQEVLQKRMEMRQDHFMPVTLLQSQLQTLEPITNMEPGIEVTVDQSVQEIVQEIAARLSLS